MTIMSNVRPVAKGNKFDPRVSERNAEFLAKVAVELGYYDVDFVVRYGLKEFLEQERARRAENPNFATQTRA